MQITEPNNFNTAPYPTPGVKNYASPALILGIWLIKCKIQPCFFASALQFQQNYAVPAPQHWPNIIKYSQVFSKIIYHFPHRI
jgi:hypothetical protein